MNGAKALLVAALVLDGIQLVLALLAIAQGRRRAQRGEPHLARYSFRHARVLAVGAVLLAVPLVLGLADVVPAWTALWIAIGAEVIVAVVARGVIDRAHRAANAEA